MTAQIDRTDFPESNAQTIKDIILDEVGQHVFNRLCLAFGGQTISFPSRPDRMSEGHFIAKVIGLENARVLAQAIGYANYYVPFPNRTVYLDADLDADPDADPVALVRKGLATWEIAKVIGHSERHVRRILNRRGVTNPNRKSRNLPGPLCGACGGGAPVQSGGFA